MERESRLSESWNSNADAWSDAVRSGALESRRLVTDAAIVGAALECPGKHVLDVGCGEGWLARHLAGAGRDVTGFDGSSALIDHARAAGGGRFVHLGYDAFVEDPHALGAFDVAICNFSLLSEAPQPLLAALRAAVHGSLLIQTLHPLALLHDGPYVDGWREETFAGMPGEWQEMPWYYRTLGSWIEQVTMAGWRLQHCREPLHPATGQPCSLLIVASAR